MQLIAGIDEAGRGPLAGPVYAAAVILNPDHKIEGLADSKTLTEKRRNFLYDQIITEALDCHIAFATVEEIDQMNILQASLLAMRRAVNGLSHQPSKVLVDGNQDPKVNYPSELIIKGDQLSPVISAASILAKVARDRVMIELDAQFPGYGFAQHKGYGTKMHMTAMQSKGVLPCHRRSFSPVLKCLPESVY